MQISTRTEDYIVDTFKLRIHIGPYLREIFKDPKKKKVFPGILQFHYKRSKIYFLCSEICLCN